MSLWTCNHTSLPFLLRLLTMETDTSSYSPGQSPKATHLVQYVPSVSNVTICTCQKVHGSHVLWLGQRALRTPNQIIFSETRHGPGACFVGEGVLCRFSGDTSPLKGALGRSFIIPVQWSVGSVLKYSLPIGYK